MPLSKSPTDATLEAIDDVLADWYGCNGVFLVPKLIRSLRYMATVIAIHAASSGKVEMFQTAPTLATSVADVHLIDIAASRGNLDVVSLLHHRGHAGCTADAMTYAAMNDHTNVVEFLATHRTEGCAWYAANRAIHDGCSLATIQVLLNHPSCGVEFSSLTVDIAARQGRVDIMHLIHPADGCTWCTQEAMDDAVSGGFLDVVRFIHEHHPDVRYTSRGLNNALFRNHLDVVKYLHTQIGLISNGYTPAPLDESDDDTVHDMRWYLKTYIMPHLTDDERQLYEHVDAMAQRRLNKRAHQEAPVDELKKRQQT